MSGGAAINRIFWAILLFVGANVFAAGVFAQMPSKHGPANARGQAPASATPLDLPLPPPVAAPTRLDVTGNWIDNFGYKFALQQSGGRTISGTVTTGCPSPVWTIAGSVTSDTTFTIRATNPNAGDTQCAATFEYRLTVTSETEASGPWSNSGGASGSVTMTRDIKVPIEFMQIGPGIARPNGVLHFDYRWESSSGNLADLANCVVGEIVKYPGSQDPFPFPVPPYSGSAANPTIIWVPGTDGGTKDNHEPTGFAKPYAENNFVAKQAFRFRCPIVGTQNFLGQTNINIVRNVKDTDGKGCFRYRITKSGSSAEISPLPRIRCNGAAPRRDDDASKVDASKVDASKVDASKVDASKVIAANRPVSASDIALRPKSNTFTVALNQPIVVGIDLLNRHDRPMKVDLGFNRFYNFAFEVRGPGGKVETRLLQPRGLGRTGMTTLAPRAAATENLLLNEWYGFDKPGLYTVRLILVGGPDTDLAGVKDNPATEFSVRVTARNEARLREIADTLAEAAISGPTFVERSDAARALSFLIDPVATNALARVLMNGRYVEGYAIAGLRRIGPPESVAVLREAARNHPDLEVRQSAQAAIRIADGYRYGAPGNRD